MPFRFGEHCAVRNIQNKHRKSWFLSRGRYWLWYNVDENNTHRPTLLSHIHGNRKRLHAVNTFVRSLLDERSWKHSIFALTFLQYSFHVAATSWTSFYGRWQLELPTPAASYSEGISVHSCVKFIYGKVFTRFFNRCLDSQRMQQLCTPLSDLFDVGFIPRGTRSTQMYFRLKNWVQCILHFSSVPHFVDSIETESRRFSGMFRHVWVAYRPTSFSTFINCRVPDYIFSKVFFVWKLMNDTT